MFKRATLSWEEAAKERAVIMKIPNVVPLGGGVPLIVDGAGVGAIGVSGATSAKDDEIARAGAKSSSGELPNVLGQAAALEITLADSRWTKRIAPADV